MLQEYLELCANTLLLWVQNTSMREIWFLLSLMKHLGEQLKQFTTTWWQ